MTIALTLGTLVRARRIELGYSQDDLATRAGLTRSFIWRFESGRTQPTIESFSRIASALNIRASKLLLQAETIQDEQYRAAK